MDEKGWALETLRLLEAERARWVRDATAALSRQPWVAGAWLVGSLGRGDADAFSDVDLVVAVGPAAPAEVITDPVAGLGLPGTILYRRPKPRYAPAGGAYLAVGVELAGLPVLVDIYVWPAATAAVPEGARIRYERDTLPRSELGFIPLIDRHRSPDTRGSDPDHPATVLMLVHLAAKYLARRNPVRLAGIGEQLALPADRQDMATLRQVLDRRIDTTQRLDRLSMEAVLRLLAVIDRRDQAGGGSA